MSGSYQRIINIIPPHDTYVEPFLGGGAIYRLKKPSLHSILVDKDPIVISNFSGSLKDNTVIACSNALDILPLVVADRKAFIYCDPPYHPDTLSSPCRYRFDFDGQSHKRLLSILCVARADVAISGYDCPLYSSMLQEWSRIDYQQIVRSGNLVTETLWFNFPVPARLHDYSYVGRDFTDRQRIKRKISRLLNRFQSMPPVERNAIFSSMVDRFPFFENQSMHPDE